MYAHATPLDGPRPGARRGRHRRRPVDVGEHLHDGRDRRRRRRRAGGQARQPVGLVEGRLAPTCSRRSASGSTCRRPASPGSASEVGITFCFAAAFHPALRHAAVPRRELGVATTFNFLGPLANPAQARRPRRSAAPTGRMAPVMAGVFARRGVDAWVFRGDDGLDELTTTTTSPRVGGRTTARSPSTRVDPARARPAACGTAEGLRGGDADYNADVVRRLLAGETGPVRDAVVLNAGAALAVHAAEAGAVDERLAAGHRPGRRRPRLRCGPGARSTAGSRRRRSSRP